jgi:hypothetical protein
VPYRDSKLTHLLQDSLGGNALTSLILTANPRPSDALQTKATLQFGSRAKLVRNTPRANVVKSNAQTSAELVALTAQLHKVESSKMKLEELLRAMNAYAVSNMGCDLLAVLAAADAGTTTQPTGQFEQQQELHSTAIEASTHVESRIRDVVIPRPSTCSTPVPIRRQAATSTLLSPAPQPRSSLRASYLAPTSASKARVSEAARSANKLTRKSVMEMERDIAVSARKQTAQQRAIHMQRTMSSPNMTQAYRSSNTSNSIMAAASRTPAPPISAYAAHMESETVLEEEGG